MSEDLEYENRNGKSEEEKSRRIIGFEVRMEPNVVI
jgi:hypothetical protein